MPNTLLTIDMITREALRILHNNLAFTATVNRQYDPEFAKSGAKIGSTLRVRRPARFSVRSGAALAVQDYIEESTTITVDQQRGVDVSFTSAELALSLDDFSARILQPAMARLASEVDFIGLGLYQRVANQVGTPGTTPQTAKVYLDAGVRLDNMACPRDGNRFVVMNPEAQAATVDSLKGLFQSSGAISEQYMKGEMGTGLGFKFGMDQNVRLHTAGGFGDNTVLINDTYAAGDTTVDLDDNSTAAGVLLAGDVFTCYVAGTSGALIQSSNPETGQNTGLPAQFVVTANNTASGGAHTGVALGAPLFATGPRKNVSTLFANNAQAIFVGTPGTAYPVNLAYHRDAFTLATADLILPEGVDMASRQTYEGISMRIVRQYDINNDAMPCRMDILFGWAALRPEWACRIAG
jgi:hypothetical protein